MPCALLLLLLSLGHDLAAKKEKNRTYKGSGRAGARGPRPSSVKDDFRRQGHSEKKKPYQVRRCGVLR